jgi:transposase
LAMSVRPMPRRDFQALEDRRKRAARLFARGLSQSAVSRELKVSRMSVSRWHRQWQQSGSNGLKAAGRAGRKPLLSRGDLQRVRSALTKGPCAHGYSTDLWTLARVTGVIETITAVRYHPGHVWKILGAMNWTLQKPERQARERNAEQVAYWTSVRWPELKKTLRDNAPGSSSRTKPASPSNPRSGGPGHREGKPRS